MGSLCSSFWRARGGGDQLPTDHVKEETAMMQGESSKVATDRPDLLDLDPSKITDSEDSHRSCKNLRPQLVSFSQCPEIIDSQAMEAIQGFYGSMTKQSSIDPEKEYCRLVNAVWPEQIKPLLSTFMDQEKIGKLLCGFVMITFDIAKGRFKEIQCTIAKVIREPFQDHHQAPVDLQRTIAQGKRWDKPDEFDKLSPDMQRQMMLHFRKEAEKVDLGEMANLEAVLQMLHEQMYINHREKSQLTSVDALRSSFQQPLARVTWMMANSQQPQYRVDRPGLMKPWSAADSRTIADVTADSDTDADGAHIQYYAKPVLYLENQIVDKGLVKVGTW